MAVIIYYVLTAIRVVCPLSKALQSTIQVCPLILYYFSGSQLHQLNQSSQTQWGSAAAAAATSNPPTQKIYGASSIHYKVLFFAIWFTLGPSLSRKTSAISAFRRRRRRRSCDGSFDGFRGTWVKGTKQMTDNNVCCFFSCISHSVSIFLIFFLPFLCG